MATTLERTTKGLSRSKKELQPSSFGFDMQRSGKIRTPNYMSAKMLSASPAEKLEAMKDRENKQNLYLEMIGQQEKAEADDRNFLERALNLNKNQGLFGDIFEVLGRPGQVVKGVLDAEGTDADMLDRAWQGFSGQRRVSGEAFMKDVIGLESKNPVANWLIGFVGDVVTDPLMVFDAPYKMAGTLAKDVVKGAMSSAGKAISKLPGGEELVQKMITVKNGVKNSVKEAFNVFNNAEYKNFASLHADKQNLANMVGEQSIKTLQDVDKMVTEIVEREYGKKSNQTLFRKMTGKENFTKEELKAAYLENAYQHIERRGYDLSTRDVMDNILNNVNKEGRGTFANAGVRSGKQFTRFKKDMDSLKLRIESMLGEKLGPEDFLIEMSTTGKGAFVKLSPRATKALKAHKNMLNQTAKDIAKYGIDNVVLAKMQRFAETGKIELNLANTEEKLLFNKLNTMLKDVGGIQIQAKGAVGTVSGLNRKQLAKFLDDPNNLDLAAFLTEKFKLNDYDYQLAMRTTGVPFKSKGDNAIANKIVNDLRETGTANAEQVVKVVGVDESAQKAMVSYTKSIADLQAVDGKLLNIEVSPVNAGLIRKTDLQFKQVVNILEATKAQMYRIPELIGDKTLAQVAEKLNIDGYMRHVVNPETILFNKLNKLQVDDPKAIDLIREFVGGDKSKELIARRWHGSARDINEMFGHAVFSNDPIVSIAVNLKILPDRFLASNLLSSAMDASMIRQLSNEEAKAIAETIKANPNIPHSTIIENSIPAEFRFLDKDAITKLKGSFSFLEGSGASSAEVAHLKSQLETLATEGGLIHRGVYNKIVSYGERMGSQSVNELISGVRKYFLDPWKKAALFSVGYHVRNLLSNAVNANLAGMPIKDYAIHFGKATKDLHTLETSILPKLNKMVKSGSKRLKTAEGQLKMMQEVLTKEEQALFNEYMDFSSKSIVGANRFTNDHYDLINKANKLGKKTSKVSKAYKATLGKVVDGSFKLGKLSDEASRIATYRWAQTEKGAKHIAKMGHDSPEAFAKFTFFDFNDLSPFEQKYMKALFPFYTWARKNIEFHIRNFMKQPDRYARMNYAMENWIDAMADDDEMSKWAREDHLIPILNSEGRITYIKMKPSYFEFEDTIKNPLISLSPLVKLPLEKLTGTNFFTHKEFTSITSGAMNDIFGDPKNIGKIFDTGEDTNSYGPGILNTRLGGAVSPIMKLLGLKGEGVNTPADLIPSMFREEDSTGNQLYNIQSRIIQRNKYLQRLRASGAYVPTQAEVFGRPRINTYSTLKSTAGYIPKLGKKR